MVWWLSVAVLIGCDQAVWQVNVVGNRRFWLGLGLPGQFLLAGAAVMTVAMLIVGTWVASSIRQTIVQNAALNAVEFVENFITPIGQELAHGDTLSDPAILALEEILARPSVSERVLSYKLWSPDGRVVHASNPEIIGQVFSPSHEFLAAVAGEVSASYESLDAPESAAEARMDTPLLEVYMPLRELWTSEIIGVVEFYENASKLRTELFNARLKSWAIVGATFVASGLLLFGIVQAGGRTIREQSEMLKAQLDLTQRIGAQNAELQRRAVSASARATVQFERMLRQLGADLHDGPAQYLALAALRLDDAIERGDARTGLGSEIRASLDHAMREIRLLSRGLALPDLDTQTPGTLIRRAVDAHREKVPSDVTLDVQMGPDVVLGHAQKLCIYRFLQESLSNAARHAPGAAVRVTCKAGGDQLVLTVADNGPGFDPAQVRRLRAEGGQGLTGLQDRLESIGGTLTIASAPGQGTELTISLPIEELQGK